MNQHHAATLRPLSDAQRQINEADLRIGGRWLRLARALWLALTLGCLLLFVLGILAYSTQIHQSTCTATNLTTCITGVLTPGNVAALRHLGLARDVYLAYTFTLMLAASLAFLIVGAIIFWRKSQEWIGLFVSFVLVAFGCSGITSSFAEALHTMHPDWWVVGLIVNSLGVIQYAALGMFFCIFPTGRFVPRWSWVLVGLWIIQDYFFTAPSDSPFYIGNWPPLLAIIELLVVWGGSLTVQVYRYRWVSDARQRQQAKWLIFGGVSAVLLLIITSILGSYAPGLSAPDSPYHLADTMIYVVLFLFIPLAIGMAILRYRLWDIDLIIKRTLLYTTLTGTLISVYVGLVFALQSLLRGIIGQTNDVAIVASTLAIAALFQPLRAGIQKFIDRRFYRSKYNATKTLETFSATLRNEVDLSQLSEHLVTVVQETMQPTQVSLWLRQPVRRPNQPGLLPFEELSSKEQ
jgi:hypothetical protein